MGKHTKRSVEDGAFITSLLFIFLFLPLELWVSVLEILILMMVMMKCVYVAIKRGGF